MTDRGSALPQRLHEVLLALAGRIDDSALSRARRLAARARADEAAELIAGTLVAGQIPVRGAEQRELGEILAAAGTDEWLAAQLTVSDNPDVVHRFSGAGAGAGLPEALGGVLERLPDVRAVHAAWRNTAAGRISGPMPQRVVLVEVGPGASELATAFRVDTALRKADIEAVVEVLADGGQRGPYHRQAMDVAECVATRNADAEPKHAPERAPAVERTAAKPAATERPAAKRAATEPPAARNPVAQEKSSAPRTPVKHVAEEKPAAAEAPERRSNGNAPVRSAVAGHARDSDGIGPGELFQTPAEPAAAEPPAAAPARRTRRKMPDLPPPPEPMVERTAELSTSELGALREKLGANGHGRGADAERTVAELPQVDDPRLSDRDRELLNELHAELAHRERIEATRVEVNAWDRGA